MDRIDKTSRASRQRSTAIEKTSIAVCLCLLIGVASSMHSESAFMQRVFTMPVFEKSSSFLPSTHASKRALT